MAILNPSAVRGYNDLLTQNMQDELEYIMRGRVKDFLAGIGPVVAPDGFGTALEHYKPWGVKRYKDALDGTVCLLTLTVAIFKHLTDPIQTIGVELRAEFVVSDADRSYSIPTCSTRSMMFQLMSSVMLDAPYSHRVCRGEDLQMGIIALANDMASELARREF